MTTTINNEIVEKFNQHALYFTTTFTEMLTEHFSHQTERRGCGYTQATRYLSVFINQIRDHDTLSDCNMFNDQTIYTIRKKIERLGLFASEWRELDQHSPQLDTHHLEALVDVLAFKDTLQKIHTEIEREENLLLVSMIIQLILPYTNTDVLHIKGLAEKPKVGSCLMAEKFFLEIAYNFIARKGCVNIIVDAHNRPLLLEKMNMGDNHSCISIVPLVLNGVLLPAGSLFSADYNEACDASQLKSCRTISGQVIPISYYHGFYFLRLMTLTVSPKNRRRAFSTHLEHHININFFSPESTELAVLAQIAQDQLT